MPHLTQFSSFRMQSLQPITWPIPTIQQEAVTIYSKEQQDIQMKKRCSAKQKNPCWITPYDTRPWNVWSSQRSDPESRHCNCKLQEDWRMANAMTDRRRSHTARDTTRKSNILKMKPKSSQEIQRMQLFLQYCFIFHLKTKQQLEYCNWNEE